MRRNTNELISVHAILLHAILFLRTLTHARTLRVKFPLLIPVRPPPLPLIVMPLVLKTGADPVPMEAPQLLHQTIVYLLDPLLAQERLNGLPGACHGAGWVRGAAGVGCDYSL